MENCPCCSGKSYNVCCGPVIKNESAPTALTLMRSRFTAYATVQAEYLHKTNHPQTRLESTIEEIEDWAKENTWTKLEILNTDAGTKNDSNGVVEFKASYTDVSGKSQVHHERSTFVKENGQWLYKDGIANPPANNTSKKVLRNDPCPCGSGKKYKKCCA